MMYHKSRTIFVVFFCLVALAITYVAISFDINHLLPRSVVLDRNAKQTFDGIDVSHHQGGINWKKVKDVQPGLDFVYVKCSEGKTYVDPNFIRNVRGASEQGYKVGAYHFFRMTSSAHEQYLNFKKQMDRVHLDLIPMVDIERDDDKPHKELQDSLRVLLNLLEKAYGKKPMIYGTQRSYNTYCAPEFNDYPLYIGKYSYSKPVVIGPSHYTIWQFSETGTINGFAGGVDLCRFHPNKSVNDITL
jgi:lysozyme